MRSIKNIVWLMVFVALSFGQQVKIGDLYLFEIKVPTARLTSVERAKLANKILDSLTFKTEIDSSEVFIESFDDNFVVYVGDSERVNIITITPMDTLETGEIQLGLASKWRDKIASGIVREREASRGIKSIMKFVLLLLYPVLLILVYILLSRFTRWASKYIMDQEGKKVKGIKFGKIQLLSPIRQTKILLRLITILKYLTFALILYFSLLVFLGQFQQTEHYVSVLKDKMLELSKIVIPFFSGAAEVLLGMLILFLILRVLLGILNFMSDKYANMPSFAGNLTKGGYDAMINTFKKFVIILFFLGVIYIIPGGDTLAFVLLLIILIIIGLAFVSIIRDFIAGYILMLRGIYQEGDTITAVDFKGVVKMRSFLFTEMTIEDGSKVILHNSLILSKPIIVHEVYKNIQDYTEGEKDEKDA